MCNVDVSEIQDVVIPSKWVRSLLERQASQGFVEVPDDAVELVDPTEIM